MSKVFITTTFTPSMMKNKVVMVEEIDEARFWAELYNVSQGSEVVPAVGHENTAEIIKERMPDFVKEKMPESLFQKINIEMQDGDWIFAIIPQFRPNETREFTDEEVKKAKFRFFIIV